jgi:hypothetical protein
LSPPPGRSLTRQLKNLSTCTEAKSHPAGRPIFAENFEVTLDDGEKLVLGDYSAHLVSRYVDERAMTPHVEQAASCGNNFVAFS